MERHLSPRGTRSNVSFGCPAPPHRLRVLGHGGVPSAVGSSGVAAFGEDRRARERETRGRRIRGDRGHDREQEIRGGPSRGRRRWCTWTGNGDGGGSGDWKVSVGFPPGKGNYVMDVTFWGAAHPTTRFACCLAARSPRTLPCPPTRIRWPGVRRIVPRGRILDFAINRERGSDFEAARSPRTCSTSARTASPAQRGWRRWDTNKVCTGSPVPATGIDEGARAASDILVSEALGPSRHQRQTRGRPRGREPVHHHRRGRRSGEPSRGRRVGPPAVYESGTSPPSEPRISWYAASRPRSRRAASSSSTSISATRTGTSRRSTWRTGNCWSSTRTRHPRRAGDGGVVAASVTRLFESASRVRLPRRR